MSPAVCRCLFPTSPNTWMLLGSARVIGVFLNGWSKEIRTWTKITHIWHQPYSQEHHHPAAWWWTRWVSGPSLAAPLPSSLSHNLKQRFLYETEILLTCFDFDYKYLSSCNYLATEVRNMAFNTGDLGFDLKLDITLNINTFR